MTSNKRAISNMKKYIAVLLAGALLAGCKDSTGLPDLNNPSLDETLSKPLSLGGFQNLLTGYNNAQRAVLGVAHGELHQLGRSHVTNWIPHRRFRIAARQRVSEWHA
ncbi:MAG: hypothetical protein ABJC63_07425 [Gemmatimonadales bacterium]